jgi:tetratricopeptide (TPR) repeat protein
MIDILDSVMNKNLTITEIYYNRALEYMYLYEYQNAVQDFESIMEATDSDEQKENMPMYYFSYSNALFYMGRLEESLLKINTALELAQNEYKEQFGWIVPTYLVQRACIYDRLYQYKNAQNDRNSATEMEPEINTVPFHIKLLDNDVVGNIMSFMDARTLINTAKATRQLHALYKSIEPMLQPKLYSVPRGLIKALTREGLKLGNKLYSRTVFSYDRRDDIFQFVKGKGPMITIVNIHDNLSIAGYTTKSPVKDGEFYRDDNMWIWKSNNNAIHRIEKSKGTDVYFGLGAAIHVGGFHIDDFLAVTLFESTSFPTWHTIRSQNYTNASVSIYEVKQI